MHASECLFILCNVIIYTTKISQSLKTVYLCVQFIFVSTRVILDRWSLSIFLRFPKNVNKSNRWTLVYIANVYFSHKQIFLPDWCHCLTIMPSNICDRGIF